MLKLFNPQYFFNCQKFFNLQKFVDSQKFLKATGIQPNGNIRLIIENFPGLISRKRYSEILSKSHFFLKSPEYKLKI